MLSDDVDTVDSLVVDTLLVDKTGTLTEGRPSVAVIVPAEGFNEDSVLAAAAALERSSELSFSMGG